MIKTELYTFVTGIIGDYQMDTTQFDTFLNIAQMYWENKRPWMTLRTEDSTQTVSTGTNFDTAKSLPSNFRKWYDRFPIVLTDQSGNVQSNLREVPINMRFNYRYDNLKFYCNYSSNSVYFCGTQPQTLTAHQFYIRKTTLVSASNTNEWGFPSEYHPILGLSVAVYWKLGVDYDIINNSQGNNNAGLANAIFQQMSEWDSDLANSSVQGIDYGSGYGWTITSNGGRLPPDIM